MYSVFNNCLWLDKNFIFVKYLLAGCSSPGLNFSDFLSIFHLLVLLSEWIPELYFTIFILIIYNSFLIVLSSKSTFLLSKQFPFMLSSSYCLAANSLLTFVRILIIECSFYFILFWILSFYVRGFCLFFSQMSAFPLCWRDKIYTCF